jgi:ABC-type phosphate transport system ATPase subunit
MVDGTDITRADVDINRVRQKIGMVFQSFYSVSTHERC